MYIRVAYRLRAERLREPGKWITRIAWIFRNYGWFHWTATDLELSILQDEQYWFDILRKQERIELLLTKTNSMKMMFNRFVDFRLTQALWDPYRDLI